MNAKTDAAEGSAAPTGSTASLREAIEILDDEISRRMRAETRAERSDQRDRAHLLATIRYGVVMARDRLLRELKKAELP